MPTTPPRKTLCTSDRRKEAASYPQPHSLPPFRPNDQHLGRAFETFSVNDLGLPVGKSAMLFISLLGEPRRMKRRWFSVREGAPRDPRHRTSAGA